MAPSPRIPALFSHPASVLSRCPASLACHRVTATEIVTPATAGTRRRCSSADQFVTGTCCHRRILAVRRGLPTARLVQRGPAPEAAFAEIPGADCLGNK